MKRLFRQIFRDVRKGENIDLYVDTYCYKSRSGSLPKYRVTEHEKSKWYEHFISQFELIWQDAQDVALLNSA